jgi:murein DD-endopeptidase MepM/ murein hydrolase activator NlpD
MASNQRESAQKGKLTNPTGGGIRRDSQGDGAWHAPRRSRKHLAIDLSATNGQDVVSPVDGIAVHFTGAKTGYPIVDITPSDTSLGIDKIRILYVDAPSGTKAWSSSSVTAGQVIGTATDLQTLTNFSSGNLYSSGVTPHVHVQVYNGGNLVDPTPYFFGP